MAAFVALESWWRAPDLESALPLLLSLGGGAALTAWVASSNGGRRVLRLSPAFILASLVALPPPATLLVLLAGFAGSRGASVAGPATRGGIPLFAVALPVALVDYLPLPGLSALEETSPVGLAVLTVIFVLIQALSVAVDALLGASANGSGRSPSRGRLPELVAETLNVPLAWILALLWARGGLTPFLVASVMIIALALLLRGRARTTSEFDRTHEALGARTTELATLHAIGRELLSTRDPSRLFSIVDRECRKLFPIDLFCVLLIDRKSRQLQRVYERGLDGAARRDLGTSEDPLVEWVTLEKRGLRLGGDRSDGETTGDDPHGRDLDLPSVLAAPLIVEDEVIGVLLIRSRRSDAYDDPMLTLLTTVAQQAAVALENARHYEMATVDALTGLYLRPYFFRRLEEEYNRAKRYGGSFGLLMIDLDGFKAINDSHGHLAGDRYLRAFGAALRARLRGADLGCRYGGDEFCLLLPETDLAGAQAIAERIRVAAADLVVHVDSLVIRTTTSIGVSAYSASRDADAKALLRKADQALYHAKSQGRDRVVPSAA